MSSFDLTVGEAHKFDPVSMCKIKDRTNRQNYESINSIRFTAHDGQEHELIFDDLKCEPSAVPNDSGSNTVTLKLTDDSSDLHATVVSVGHTDHVCSQITCTHNFFGDDMPIEATTAKVEFHS